MSTRGGTRIAAILGLLFGLAIAWLAISAWNASRADAAASPPVMIDDGLEQARLERLERGPQRYTVATYIARRANAPKRKGLYISVREPDAKSFGAPRQLLRWREGAADFDVGEDGFTVVARRPGGEREIEVRTREADGDWSDPTVVGQGLERSRPRVVVGRDGGAVVAWMKGAAKIVVAVRPAGGDFLAPQVLELDVVADIGSPAISLGENLDGALAWGTKCEDPGADIQAVALDGGVLGPPEDIDGSGCAADDIDIASADDGATTLLISSDADAAVAPIAIATRPSGGSFTAAQPLEQAAGAVSDGQIEASGEGEAIAAWRRGRVPNATLAAIGTSLGTFGPRLPVFKGHTVIDDLVMNGNGAAVLSSQPTPNETGYEVAWRAPGSALFGQPASVTPPGFSNRLVKSALAINAAARATIAWVQRSGDGQRVLRARDLRLDP